MIAKDPARQVYFAVPEHACRDKGTSGHRRSSDDAGKRSWIRNHIRMWFLIQDLVAHMIDEEI
jgi:hypothetical protein